MTKRNRVFFGIVLGYLLGAGWLLYSVLVEIDPRYRESAEESLVETSQFAATLIEQQMLRDGTPDVGAQLAPLFRALYERRFDAQIFSHHKTRVELRMTVTDAAGRVLFDSQGAPAGADHSQWRDVKLALQGDYGARTTRDVASDERSAVMYVAAPIRANVGGQTRIVGAVSVGKPVQSFGQFVAAARSKTLLVGLYSSAAVLLLMLILSAWLVRPFGIVGDYVRHVRDQRRLSLPRLSRSMLGAIGAAYDEMRDALAGRSYVADYVQTLTHELKSPLSAIRGAAELLQEPMPAADQRRFIDNIGRETQRIQELVDRMMELAEIEARRRLAGTAPVAIAPLLEEIAASANVSGAARGITVRLALPAGAPAYVEGDAFLLSRAVTNLVDNALDFSNPGGTVELTLATTPRTVEIRVRDHGPGIPEYAASKVFEKFYSLARPATQKKSTGLGLAFVQQIAELHRGRATLANAADGPGALAVLALRRAAPRG